MHAIATINMYAAYVNKLRDTGEGGQGGGGGDRMRRGNSAAPLHVIIALWLTLARTRQPLKNSLVWNKMCHSQNIKTLI